jgi:DNA-binding XRE family transcriptional regulator
METWREKLEAAAKEHGVDYLHHVLGVSRQTIYNWLNGHKVSAELAFSLASFLEVEPSSIRPDLFVIRIPFGARG